MNLTCSFGLEVTKQFLSFGKYRGLQQCASPRSAFTLLALDHRQNLRKANPHHMESFEIDSI